MWNSLGHGREGGCDDAGALAMKSLGDGAADATRRSGDDAGLSRQPQFTRFHVWVLQNTLMTQPETSTVFGPLGTMEPA